MQLQRQHNPATPITKNKKSQSVRTIELEVNISIGKNKYLLQVEKCSNLHVEVEKFLKQHGLNAKYKGPILAMVRDQLAKRDTSKIPKNQYIEELKKIKTQIDDKKKSYLNSEQNQQSLRNHAKFGSSQSNEDTNQVNYFQKENKQNLPDNFSRKSNEQQIYSQKHQKQQSEENKCQDVYQKWKMKEKIKEQTKKLSTTPNKHSSKEKSVSKSFISEDSRYKQVSQKKSEAHQADYFYKRGLKFKYAKQVHAEELFKQKYPFQINRDCSLTPTKKIQLHQRLYQELKVKQAQKIQKQIQQKMSQKPKKPMDKYKQRVIERDKKVNQVLNYCLSNKLIENPYKIQTVSKSPFRKTNCY